MTTIKEYLKIVDDVIASGKFKDNWDSLSQFVMPKWYKEGRFGIFIHWGVYSVPATENEWYPRQMYLLGTKSYMHRLKNYGKDCDYRQIIDKFKPTKFNADEWLDVFKKSGAQYIMPVGEHHDGVKMYQSDLNRWNMAALNGVNYIDELHKSCDKNGIGFLMSNHRAEHYWFLNGARKFCKDSEVVTKEEYRDLYGDAFLSDGGNPWTEMNLTENRKCIATTEWLEDWLASACEMIDKNQPLAVYFDWWVHNEEFRPYMKKFLAYYYNRGIEWGKEVGVFYKWGAIMKGCAIFDVERGQLDGISPALWQNDTAIAKNSWGYTEGNSFKTPYEIICNMIEVVAKNGCYMLNVGPKSDGTICEQEKAVLLAIGKWLSINGEAIYGSEPCEVGYGEGKKQVNGAFKESAKFCKKDYRFTYKTGAIYAFPMCVKAATAYAIKSLKFADEGGIRYIIKSVEALGYPNVKVSFKHTAKELSITLSEAIVSDTPICFKINIE